MITAYIYMKSIKLRIIRKLVMFQNETGVAGSLQGKRDLTHRLFRPLRLRTKERNLAWDL